jgi:hypothetical protein
VQLVELEVVPSAERHQRLVRLITERPDVAKVVEDDVDRRPAPGAPPLVVFQSRARRAAHVTAAAAGDPGCG